MKMKYLFKKSRLYWLFILIPFTACNNDSSSKSLNHTDLKKIEEVPLTYILPSPRVDGNVSVERALANRRSQRQYLDRELTAEHLSQILWAAYGVTDPRPDVAFLRGGLRTAPSAGALYPFEIYVAVGQVKGIESGIYHYISQEHKIVRKIEKDIRADLCIAALNQSMVREAPAVLIYCAIYSRMTEKYGDRGRDRYVCMDLGHSAENVYLQAEALNLGSCTIGAFYDEKISELLKLPENEEPLCIMPFGHYLRK
jgi:SagB-type dehydrogenase family enzyme